MQIFGLLYELLIGFLVGFSPGKWCRVCYKYFSAKWFKHVCNFYYAVYSFLGLGLPSEIPTWGNIMAEARVVFSSAPHNMWFPGIFLGLTVLAVNVLGDGLRDTLDPKFNKRGENR